MFRIQVLTLLLLSPFAAAQVCEAPPDVQTAIQGATHSATASQALRVDSARTVRDRFPDDYFAHRFYQDQFFSNPVFSEAVQDEYKSLLDAHPDDTLYRMLYGRTLLGTNTPQLIDLLNKVLARDPDYPPAHQKFTEIYSSEAFLDLAKLRTHLEAYWKACRSSLTGYSLAPRIEDAGFLAATSARLRKLVDARSDNEALGIYQTLWQLEFKAVPLSAQGPVRERIRGDAAKLRAMQGPPPLSELRDAYRMLGDREGLKWVEDQMPKPPSSMQNLVEQAVQTWNHEHPFKAYESEAREDALIVQTAEWVKRWPNDPRVRYERFEALVNSLRVPVEDVVRAANEWIEVYQVHPSYGSPYLRVASFYARQRIHFQDLPALLEKVLRDLPPISISEPPIAPVSDLYLPNPRPAVSQDTLMALGGMEAAIAIYLQIKDYDKAREWLAKLGPPLFAAARTAKNSTDPRLQFRSLEFRYWLDMVSLARADGRKMDALDAARKAFYDGPAPVNTASEARTRAEWLEQWKALKGTEEGFDAWAARPADTAPPPPARSNAADAGWTTLNRPLPDFEVADAIGRTWRLADLKGKVTFINLWATWCVPCQTELPFVQKLADKLRDRSDLAVLTLNIDENRGLILPFLSEHRYTFPVLPADAALRQLVPESIPRNWLVDANGVLRRETVSSAAGDAWVDAMIAAMEKARP